MTFETANLNLELNPYLSRINVHRPVILLIRDQKRGRKRSGLEPRILQSLAHAESLRQAWQELGRSINNHRPSINCLQ